MDIIEGGRRQRLTDFLTYSDVPHPHAAAEYIWNLLALDENPIGAMSTERAERFADPLAAVRVGDDDPTGHGVFCTDEFKSWLCTRTMGHSGQHISGNGTRVDAVWPRR